MKYKDLLKSLKTDKRLLDKSKIAIIKDKLDAKDYRLALESYPLLYGVLRRNAFFEDVSKIVIKTPYFFTNSIEKEIEWVMIQLLPYLKKIDSFLTRKNRFEDLLILGNYSECEKILEETKREFGVNLWYFESKLLLLTYSEGNEANWSLLSDLLKEIKNPFYEFNINSSSKRFEKKFSFESYFNQFQNDINGINADAVIKDYFVFKNFGIAKYDYEFTNLEGVLFLSNIFSIIDLYLIFIDIIIFNFCNKSDYSKEQINEIVSKLIKEINHDIRLVNLNNILNCNPKIENVNTSLIESLNLYYEGNYNESISVILKGLSDNPCEFEFYVLYAKCLIALESEFKPTQISVTIDEIIESLYGIFLFDENSNKHHDNLLKFALSFLSFPISRQLFSLLTEVDGHKNNSYYLGVFYSQFFSPNFLYFINDYNLNNNFEFLNNNVSYKVGLTKMGIEDNSSLLKGNVKNLTIAEYNFSKKDYQKVIDLNEQSFNFSNYYKEKYISFLYISYIQLKNYEEAIQTYINYFFDEKLYFKKLDYYALLNLLKDGDLLLDYSDSLDFVIFSSLSLKEFDLYEVLDEFLSSIDIFTVREINFELLIDKYGVQKTIFFMKNILIVDVIKYFDYSSISNVEDDRVMILQKLSEIDNENKSEYESQISNIYRTHSVRKVLKDVDEGRLYIDVENLQKHQVKKLNDEFTRFKEIEKFSESNILIGFNSSNKRDWENAIKERIDYNAQYNSADYLAFKNIYLESRDSFLYSKEYGLESCLSTRIRHGALKNHIRSVFEKLDLITVKSNEKYLDNEKVEVQLYANPDLNKEVQVLLKNFSREVDNINLSIINNYMQIQTERSKDNQYGLFSYVTNDEILFDFYTKFKTFFDSTESIVSIILENFVSFTLIEISKSIIEFFTEFVLGEFEKLIDELILELKNLNLPTECELLNNLNKSKTEIQKEIDYIADWFFLSTDSSSTLLDVETILHASIELTNKINPLFLLNPKISIENNVMGYSNFIFIFNILFNNVIENSKVDVSELKLEVNVYKSEDKKYTIVKFTNNLNPKVNYDENIRKLQEVKDNWNDHSRIERSNKESGSGFDKIKRILIYEARAKTDLFDFEMKNNNMSILLYLPYSERVANE